MVKYIARLSHKNIMEDIMKYKADVQKGKAVINFTVNAEEWEKALEDAYQKNKNKYTLKGFRKGHVPKAVLEATFGKDLFFEDAFNLAFPKYYQEVLDKHQEIFPVDRPEVGFDSLDEKGFKFTATVVTKPEVELGKYKGLRVKKTVVKVTDADVEEELKRAQDRSARLVEVDRAAENGDQVVLDYSGSVDGVKFDGGTAQKQTLVLGSKTFIPGFEEQIVGMKKGEEKDVKVKFPDDYRAENLKGREAVFAVKFHEIRFKELPALDDEFAKDVSEFDTLEEYKNDIRKNLTEEKTKRAEMQDENALVEMIVKDSKTDIPNAMVETQIDSYVEEFAYNLMYQGLNLEDYLKYSDTTKEKLRENYRQKAEIGVKTRLVMEAIIKDIDLKADAKSVDAKIKTLAKDIKQDYKEYKQTLSDEHLSIIKNQVLSEKLTAYLKTENTFY